MPDKDRLHAELSDDLRRGVVSSAKAAALFDIDEAKLRRLAMEAYPLSLPDDAVAITTKQLAAAVEAAKQGGDVQRAIAHLDGASHEAHVVRLVVAARTAEGGGKV